MPLRPSRSCCWESFAVRAPLIVIVGVWQLTIENGKAIEPPSGEVIVSVKLIVVPHTNDGDVLTANPTWLAPVTFSIIVGKVVFGCVIMTFGVFVESTAVTFDEVRQPMFWIVTFSVAHSSLSIVASPLPPETADEMKANFGVPVRHPFWIVTFPFVIVTLNGPIALQLCAGSPIVTW